MKQYREATQKEKQQIKEILTALPDWFGIPEAIEEYVKDSNDLPVFACFDEETMIGFLTLKPTSKDTCELYVMGILPSYHHQGIGKQLYQQARAYAITQDFHFLQVKTLSPKAENPSYLKTYAFYCAMGFCDVEVLPLWDEWNPCLMMIQKLDAYKPKAMEQTE